MTNLDVDEVSGPRAVLSRDNVPEIIAALNDPRDTTSRTWNIVEVLEVLIDAGHFLVAENLAERVLEMMQHDGRSRLFKGYWALCSLMIRGDQSVQLAELERLYLEINHTGHSVADRVRAGVLLARGLALCVGLGTLGQAALLRTRQILGIELRRVSQTDDIELRSQVVLDLAKTYLHAPIPDPLAAHALVVPLKQELVQRGVSLGRAFDLSRVLYQAARMIGAELAPQISEDSLREEAQVVGGVARALAELAIARRSSELAVDMTERAAEILQENEFVAGAFEAFFLLGTNALDRGYNVVAERYLRRALELSTRGGFEHGSLVVLIGLFQCASISDNRDELRRRAEAVVEALGSELALGSSGLNAAAAQQIVGDVEGALRTAKRCERFFSRQRLPGFRAQALAIEGTCEAHRNRWDKAAAAWRKAVAIDVERYAFIQGCERKGLVAQAIVMHDMTTCGQLRDATARKAHKLLAEADAEIGNCGELPEAIETRARLQSIHAQVSLISGEYVRALRHLSSARTLFDSLGKGFDVAMADAFTGLSMIEVGKSGTPDILEEAVLTLQRAHQFFSSPACPAIRWKILYYLAVAALRISNGAAEAGSRVKWRELAIGWVRSAEADLKSLEGDINSSTPVVTGQSDFSPGLKRDSLEALKHALGVRQARRSKAEESIAEKDTTAGGGVVH